MVIDRKIKNYLDEMRVNYQILQHDPTYTATETAEAQHVPGKQFIKSVIVKADGRYIMCVLSANHLINFAKLKKKSNFKDAYLASEEEVESLFPGCEPGAEPPFGALFGLEVLVDRAVSENDEIIFNSGTHTDTIKIRYKDFARLSKAVEMHFGEHI